ncbi:unnamed protein product [Paramecium sonneborni]|uniref:Uncharacterized protein n=1 Tax=Paramecium sonneborni TaxID=65129 RepID=A0A8S1NCD6_9CILI|nr:unnamed protein product [Paramecium sonneborni]
MIQIQEAHDEWIKQQLQDAAFCKNQVQTNSSFKVSEIIPIFPNQIIYEMNLKIIQRDDMNKYKNNHQYK